MIQFIFPALLLATQALGQTAFYPGASVRMDTYGSEDDLFAKVLMFNGFNAKIELNRIIFKPKLKQPEVVTQQFTVPADRIRALNETDFCFEPGSLVRVTNQYLAISDVVGTVFACDGRQIILEYQPTPNTSTKAILQMGDVASAQESAPVLQANDLVTFVAPGFSWSGLPGRVTFSNGSYAWVEYQDKNFNPANTKVLVDDLVIDSRIPRPEFRLGTLGNGLQVVASISHGSRKSFFNEIAAALDRFLPNTGKTIDPSSIRSQARHYAMLAIRPVIEAGTSQIYTETVIPAYQLAVEQYNVKSLNEFALTNESSISAAIVLGAVLEAVSNETVSDLERKVIKDQEMRTGLLIAAGGKPAATLRFLQDSSVMTPILVRWLTNPVLKSYAITYQTVLNDLGAKLQ